QVTINGYPIYYYAEDMAPGQVKGNGADGTWHVIKIRVTGGTMAASRNTVRYVEGRQRGVMKLVSTRRAGRIISRSPADSGEPRCGDHSSVVPPPTPSASTRTCPSCSVSLMKLPASPA